MQRPALFSVASLGLLLCGCPAPGATTDTSDESTAGPNTSILPPTSGDTSSSGSESASTTGIPDPTTSLDTSTTTDTTGPMACDEFTPPPIDPVVPRVMLVLDKSGSMIFKGNTDEPNEDFDGFWDHDNDPNTPEVTRWMSLHSVVESIFASLDGAIEFGATLFPAINATGAYNPNACLAPTEPLVSIGPNMGAAILDAMPPADSTTIAGGTPATVGMEVAIAELASLQDEEPKLIILVTDGAANCKEGTMLPELFNEYDDNLPPTVASAKDMGFPTYVIGIDIADITSPTVVDGSPDNVNTFEKLNELAEMGGTARPGDEKFYNASNQIELQAALEEITKQILSCEISLGGPVPPNFYIQRVEVGSDEDPGQLVYVGIDEQVANCDSESGWQYTDENREAILLCGDACEHYKETGIVEIEYGCLVK